MLSTHSNMHQTRPGLTLLEESCFAAYLPATRRHFQSTPKKTFCLSSWVDSWKLGWDCRCNLWPRLALYWVRAQNIQEETEKTQTTWIKHVVQIYQLCVFFEHDGNCWNALLMCPWHHFLKDFLVVVALNIFLQEQRQYTCSKQRNKYLQGMFDQKCRTSVTEQVAGSQFLWCFWLHSQWVVTFPFFTACLLCFTVFKIGRSYYSSACCFRNEKRKKCFFSAQQQQDH